MQGDLSFVSIGCNRLCNCASWSSNGLLAFGAGNFVGLYSCKDQNLKTLRAHKDRVNCVKWINENEIVSGSTDSSLIIWKNEDNIFKPLKKLQIHNSSITSISVISYPNDTGKTIIVATSTDKTVSIWMRLSFDNEFELQQHDSLAGEAVECCSLHFLPQTENNMFVPILALGGVGGSGSCRGSEIIIYLPFTNKEGKLNFKRTVTLKGHEDWIRCLSFITCDDGNVLLASSAQDNFIRLWKLETGNDIEKDQKEKTDDIFASLAMLDSIHSTSMSQQGHTFQHENNNFSIILESVLYGHEDWVYSVCWQPPILLDNGKTTQPLCLLSASMDKTMMIWRPQEDENGIWVNEVRVGELGGNTLGFFGGLFSPDGKKILAHGYNGAFHLWENNKSISTNEDKWEPLPTISGHFGPVNDCSWDPAGDYFLTVSKDQTARIFSAWKKPNTNDSIYCEVARPQIHGYDIECGCFVQGKTHCFVTGAEEKIFRIFDAPKSFIHNFESITGKKIADLNVERPLGANVPSLGLSNKPVFTLDANASDTPIDKNQNLFEAPKPADPVFITRPPFEEELLQSTLWPEIQKLYGHGNYTFCVSSSKSGDLLATAVRAKSDPEQATIRLWETNTWKEIANLRAHKLTITQLSFSNNDKYLLSSGRDRQFSIFKRTEDGSNFELIHKQPKAHDRIIWSCDWSHDDKFFITGSRDKTCKIWSIDETNNVKLESKFVPSKSGITSVSFAPITIEKDGEQEYIIAIGMETGLMQLWTFNKNKTDCVLKISPKDSHCDEVKRIKWKIYKETEENTLQFISCSSDHSVRLFTIKTK